MQRPSSQLFAVVSLCGSLATGFFLPTDVQGQDAASSPADTTVVLEAIVVTATPVPLAQGALGSHVSVLSGDALRADGVSEVADALRTETGVTIVRNGSFGSLSSLFLRGGESDYVQVLLDGVPLNQPGGAIDLSGLTMENVERIEVVRGPVSGLYGSDAMAGVVQIITRAGAGGLSGSGTVRGGSFGSLDGILEVGGGNDTGSFGISAGRYESDGILEFNNGRRNTVLSGRAELRIDEASTARVTARLQDRVYRFPTDASGAVVDINQSSFSEEASLGIQIDRAVSERLGLRALVTLQDSDSGTDDAPDGPDDNIGFYGFQSLDAMRRVTGDLRANWSPSDITTLTVGAEVEQQRMRSFTESLSEFGPSAGRSKNSRSNQAAYAHGLTAFGRLALNGGIRVENNEQYGNFMSFQAGSAVALRPGTRLRVAAGRGIKEPTFLEAFGSGFAKGNPDLDPERSSSWELGLEQVLGAVRIGATWFDQSFQDLIQFTFSPPNPTDPNYFNVAEAESRGVELELEVPLSLMDLTAGWTWLDTKVIDSGFDEGRSATFVEGESLIRRPPNQGTLGARGGIADRWRWSAEVRWVDDRSDRDFSSFPAERVTLESHTVLNLGVDATVIESQGGRPGLDVIIRAENLTDAKYQEAFGFDAPGRGVYLGGRVRWEDR